MQERNDPIKRRTAKDSVNAESPLRCFEQSMIMDHEKWHDGIGYDLDALREASPSDRETIEKILIARGPQDWRDIEALAVLNTEEARKILKTAIHSDHAEIRAAVLRHAPDLVSESEKTASLVKALETAEFYGGLAQSLDEVADFHPPEVVDALIHGALHRSGEVAVHFAAMLTFIHGKASEPFDWEQRPFFLRFHTNDRTERETVFRELCAKIGIDR